MSGYRSASVLEATAQGQRLGLATALAATPDGLVDNPTFFSGLLARPDVAASGILAVADVAGSRFADPDLMKRLANLDPVVTAGSEVLRFESFSACNGVYARLDLTSEGLGSSEVGFGTTNVDVNEPLRLALARTSRAVPLHLSVGRDELRASTPDATHVERKVSLSERWVRGLAEVPVLLAASRPVGQLVGAPAVGRFLASLPRVEAPGPDLYVLPVGGAWRTTPAAVPGSVALLGASRLRGLDRLARHAMSLSLYAHPHGTTAWVVEVPGARFTLAVSPHPYRGFSGEGTLLTLLSHPEAEQAGQQLLGMLGWSAVVDEVELAARSGLAPSVMHAGLAWLAASGRLGHDLTTGSWFHRELPVDSLAVVRRTPRLTRAARLVAAGAVTDVRTPGAAAQWQVRGTDDQHEVRVADDRLACSCRWEREHSGTRGPCAHVLAVLLTLHGRGADVAD